MDQEDGGKAAVAAARFNGAEVVLLLEEMLMQVGVFQDAWKAQLRDAWIASLREPGRTIGEVALHVLAMQQFITTTENVHVLTRAGFQRRVSEAR